MFYRFVYARDVYANNFCLSESFEKRLDVIRYILLVNFKDSLFLQYKWMVTEYLKRKKKNK